MYLAICEWSTEDHSLNILTVTAASASRLSFIERTNVFDTIQSNMPNKKISIKHQNTPNYFWVAGVIVLGNIGLKVYGVFLVIWGVLLLLWAQGLWAALIGALGANFIVQSKRLSTLPLQWHAWERIWSTLLILSAPASLFLIAVVNDSPNPSTLYSIRAEATIVLGVVSAIQIISGIIWLWVVILSSRTKFKKPRRQYARADTGNNWLK